MFYTLLHFSYDFEVGGLCQDCLLNTTHINTDHIAEIQPIHRHSDGGGFKAYMSWVKMSTGTKFAVRPQEHLALLEMLGLSFIDEQSILNDAFYPFDPNHWPDKEKRKAQLSRQIQSDFPNAKEEFITYCIGTLYPVHKGVLVYERGRVSACYAEPDMSWFESAHSQAKTPHSEK